MDPVVPVCPVPSFPSGPRISPAFVHPSVTDAQPPDISVLDTHTFPVSVVIYASPLETPVLLNKSPETSILPCKFMVPGSIPPIFVPASNKILTPSDFISTPPKETVLPEAEISTTYIVSNHLSAEPKFTPFPERTISPLTLIICPATAGTIS